MQTAVKEIVDLELRRLGFSRKTAWYRDMGKVVHVVGLQKSQWGRNYYLNLAIWLKSFGQKQFPRPSECPLQCRIDGIAGTPKELSAALDEEEYWRMTAEQRVEIVRLAICNAEFVFFSKLKTTSDIGTFLKTSHWPEIAIHRDFMKLVS